MPEATGLFRLEEGKIERRLEDKSETFGGTKAEEENLFQLNFFVPPDHFTAKDTLSEGNSGTIVTEKLYSRCGR